MKIASLHRITALSSMPPAAASHGIEKKITEIKDEVLNSLSNHEVPFSQRSIVSVETPADLFNRKKLAGILPPELYAEVFSFCAPSANLACVHPNFVDCNEKTAFSATFLLDALQKYETAKETNNITKKHYLNKINALIKNKHLVFSPKILKKIVSILYLSLHDIYLNSLVKYVLKKVETFPDLYKKQIDLAARYGLTAEMTELIKNPQATDEVINDVFFIACMSGQHEIVSLLLTDKKVDPSTDHNDAIRFASTNGHAEVVKLLLADERVDPSAHNNYAIRFASANGHTEVVRLLLTDTRVDPSANNNYAIQWTSYNGHDEIVRLLLDDTRVDPSADNNYAVRWASIKGHAKVVRMLLDDTRVDPSVDDNYVIQWASYNGHAEVVRLLLDDTRVDPSTEDNKAFRWSSGSGHTEVVRLLLANARVDPSANNNEAIRLASKNGHAEVLKLLLAHSKVDPSAYGNYAIQQARAGGHVEVVRLLLSNTKVLNTLNNKTLAEILVDAKERDDVKIINVIEWHLKMDSFVTKQVLSRIFKPIAVIALTAAVSSVINYINAYR